MTLYTYLSHTVLIHVPSPTFSKTVFWATLKSFQITVVPSWGPLFEAAASGLRPLELCLHTQAFFFFFSGKVVSSSCCKNLHRLIMYLPIPDMGDSRNHRITHGGELVKLFPDGGKRCYHRLRFLCLRSFCLSKAYRDETRIPNPAVLAYRGSKQTEPRQLEAPKSGASQRLKAAEEQLFSAERRKIVLSHSMSMYMYRPGTVASSSADFRLSHPGHPSGGPVGGMPWPGVFHPGTPVITGRWAQQGWVVVQRKALQAGGLEKGVLSNSIYLAAKWVYWSLTC